MARTKEQILNLIQAAGVVGAGGAGFPTHVKLNSAPEYVIANCAECEPLIKSDKYLMELHADEIVEGMKACLEATGAAHGVLAVKAKNTKAVEELQRSCADEDRITVHLLENYYPAGDEQQIIYEVTHRVIPVGQLPISVGCVVINAQTLFHVSQAVQGRPVVSRHVTVCGEVASPVTLNVPIGTAVSYLIDLAGGPAISDYAVIIGGPLMGRVSFKPDEEFVTKTTNGIILIPKDHPLIEKKVGDFEHQYKIAKSACCQCNYCSLICPRSHLGLGVQPHKIMQALTLNNADVLTDGLAALGCCNCGLCTYVGCNMGLTPNRFIYAVRADLLKKKVKTEKQPGAVNPMRDLVKAPSHRVIQRTGIAKYDRDIPYLETYRKPGAVRIMLRQHIGAACVPQVSRDDRVETGDCIGMPPEGALGARVHASIGGTVIAVTEDYIDIMDL